MKAQKIRQLVERKEKIERGEAAPAAVWDVRLDDKGGFTHKKLDPKLFRRQQKHAWDRSIAATRQKLGLSQTGFADLLGISVRTLHHWEQGTRRPSGAARVLLRVAEKHPEIVLDAVAYQVPVKRIKPRGRRNGSEFARTESEYP
jgi:DNA-binding transcriptional regulator YiaG